MAFLHNLRSGLYQIGVNLLGVKVDFVILCTSQQSAATAEGGFATPGNTFLAALQGMTSAVM